MKLGLVVHPGRAEAEEIARRLVEEAHRRGMTVVARPADAGRTGAEEGELDAGVDVVVAVGGDGTVLAAAALALEAGVPLFGVNAGRVGFMAEVEASEVPEALSALAEGRGRESRRMTLAVEVQGGQRLVGLNDVVVEKVYGARAVTIRLEVEGEHLHTYHADGLMVATPTGSTAYNLSAGGPLVHPELSALVVTPVASHSLFGRSMVFDGSTRLRLVVGEDRPGGVNLDGREVARLGSGEGVAVTAGPEPVRFLRLTDVSFPQVVRRRFLGA